MIHCLLLTLFNVSKMLYSYFVQQIKENFPYQPTLDQEKVIKSLAEFLFTAQPQPVYLLRGFAGTGKTSLVSALVRTLDKQKQPSVLLAPTGRAAKVFAGYSGHPAYTIHKKIYRQQSFSNALTNFSLSDNLHKHTLFIVDEASMIANDGLSGSMFGTGLLLDDLIHYVYSSEGCRLMLLGDTAQLPPVGEDLSPALSEVHLAGYGLTVFGETLTDVVRQADGSGILWNATALRQLIDTGECYALPKLRIAGFRDVRVLPGNELIDALEQCYRNDGEDETLVVTRSNKRANLYNNGIRNQILWREDELEAGDRLMVVKNNYYWTAQDKNHDFLANGEMVVVRRVRNTRQMYGFRFADVELTLADYDDAEIEVTLLLDTLRSEAPALSREDMDLLFERVLEDYADIPLKADRMKKVKEDIYYNALQVKYAYAVTCHKAQGGQWTNIFLDQGYMSEEYLTPGFCRWLYTAFTRATGTLYLVNYPPEGIE